MLDWAQTVDWQAWATFSQALAILGASWFAKATYTSWQRQKIADREVEVAEEALSLAYEAEEVFKDIRSPLSFHDPNEFKELSEAERAFRRYAKRIERYGDFFEKLIAALPSARAILDKRVFDGLRRLAIIRQDLYNSLDTYVDLAYDNSVPLDEENKNLRNKCRRHIYALNNEDDEISIEIRIIIEQIEKVVLPILRQSVQNRA